jgi:hypothetical protein
MCVSRLLLLLNNTYLDEFCHYSDEYLVPVRLANSDVLVGFQPVYSNFSTFFLHALLLPLHL